MDAEQHMPSEMEEPEEHFESSRPVSDEEHDGDNTKDTELRKMPSLQKAVSLPREILVVAVIALAQFTTQIGLGQILSTLHIIARSFHIGNPGIENWLVAGYSLTVGTFILISGRMGDVFGWKQMLVIGYAWFAIASLVAGLSVYSSYVLFIFARVFQGIGPAICLPNALALLGALYEPGPRKNMAFAIFAACAPVGSIIGAVFGAIFGQLSWWPWTFWSFALVLAAIAVTAAIAMPNPQTNLKAPGSLKACVEELDLAAATVGVTALILFNFAWNQAPIVGWHSSYVCVCLALGVLLVPVFFYLEIKIAPNPLVPFSALNSTNAYVLGCIACGWSNFGILIYYLWQVLENLRGSPPLLASAYLTPFTISGALAALITGFLLNHLRPAWLMVIAMSAFLAGNLLLATLPPDQIYWAQIFVITLIAPFGMDMSFPAATVYLSNTVEKHRQGIAASLVNTVVNYSISLGLGFAGTVEVNVNHGGQTWEDQLRGYRGALYMGTGLSGLGLALSIFFVLKTYRDDRLANKSKTDLESKPQ